FICGRAEFASTLLREVTRPMLRLLVWILMTCAAGAGPGTGPAATRPTTAPARVRDGLVNGSIRFLVPADWEIDERGESRLAVKYKLPEDRGSVTVLVNQQAQGIPQDNAGVRRQVTQAVLAAHNEDLKKVNAEVIDARRWSRTGGSCSRSTRGIATSTGITMRCMCIARWGSISWA